MTGPPLDRALELQKLADKHRSPEGGGSMKISPTHLGGAFMVDYATVNGLMDWTECVLEACIHGVGGTVNVLAGLKEGPQRDAAIQGSGRHGLDTDRLSFDMDETYAVNELAGAEYKEFGRVVKAAADRGEAVQFKIQFYRATTDAETGTSLDPKIWEINDDVAVAQECFKNSRHWPEVLLKSQLFEALQNGPRLLMNRPNLKLNEFVNSNMFRDFLTRTKQSKKEKQWWRRRLRRRRRRVLVDDLVRPRLPPDVLPPDAGRDHHDLPEGHAGPAAARARGGGGGGALSLCAAPTCVNSQ